MTHRKPEGTQLPASELILISLMPLGIESTQTSMMINQDQSHRFWFVAFAVSLSVALRFTDSTNDSTNVPRATGCGIIAPSLFFNVRESRVPRSCRTCLLLPGAWSFSVLTVVCWPTTERDGSRARVSRVLSSFPSKGRRHSNVRCGRRRELISLWPHRRMVGFPRNRRASRTGVRGVRDLSRVSDD